MVVDSFWFPEVVYWLSGLTSDHKTFSEKAGAFQAACDLVFYALQQPCGYTEPLLHRHRKSHKEVVLS